jgi:hypothetical protein
VPKLKLGAAVYALIAIGLGIFVVLVLRHVGPYAEVHGWPIGATVVVDGLASLLFAVGAVTRRGLNADDGPRICQNGWLLLVALTAAGCMIAFVGGEDVPLWPMGPAVFLPRFIRRMQESYYDGVAEAEREIMAGGPDAERPRGL